MPARTKLPFKDCPSEDVIPTVDSRARGKEIASVSANVLTGEKIAMDTIPSFEKNRSIPSSFLLFNLKNCFCI